MKCITNIENDNISSLEDKTFPLTFTVLKFAGCWKSTNFKKSFNVLYNIYSAFFLINIIIFLITMIVEMIFFEKSIYDFVGNLFLTITIVNGVCKRFNINLKRSNILKILQNFVDIPWRILQDNEEIKIIENSMYSEKFITGFCIFSVTLNILSIILKPIIESDQDTVVEAYALCNRSKPFCFWLNYLHQACSYTSICLTQIGYDCTIFCSTLRISSLFKLLKHRILKLPNLIEIAALEYHKEKKYIEKCIREHHYICKIFEEFNDAFYTTVSIQFFSSIAVICTNIYLLSIQKLFSISFNTIFIYLFCVLLQNFFFCWYGYKITENSLKVSESIFNMNWCILQKESKKMLIYIMLKTSKPIYVFSSSFVKLTPESFISIIKLSYSVFNILQQTPKKD